MRATFIGGAVKIEVDFPKDNRIEVFDRGIPREIDQRIYKRIKNSQFFKIEGDFPKSVLPPSPQASAPMPKLSEKVALDIPVSPLVKTVAIERLGGLGDILITLSVVRPLKRKYPKAKIVFICQEKYIELAKACIGVDEVIPWPKYPFKADIKYNLDWQLEPTTLEKGHLNPDVYNTKNRHEITYALVGLGSPIELPELNLPRIDLGEYEIDKTKKTVGIVIGCAARMRIYPAEMIRELVEKFEPDYNIVLLGQKPIRSFGGWEHYEALTKMKVIDLTDKTSIIKLAQIINQLDLLIAPDTGILHLAGVLKVRALGLFGTIDPELRCKHYETVETLFPRGKMPCIPCNDINHPCLKDSKQIPPGAECVRMITPDQVYNKSKKMLCLSTGGEKVLIKRDGGIGDVLMITAILEAIREDNPDTAIYFETLYPELLEGHNVFPIIKGAGEGVKPDKIITLNRAIETKQVGGGILDEEESETTNRMDLLFDAAGYRRSENPKIRYYLHEKEIETARRDLKEKGLKKEDILIGYAGVPVAQRRGYPLLLTKQLVDLLCQNAKVKIIFFGHRVKNLVESDRKIINKFPESKVFNFIDKTTIREMAALISCCDVMVACDSGPLHLANAIGIPNVALFGTIEPWLRTKYYPLCKTIFPEGKLKCIPCNDRGKECKEWSRIDKDHTIGGECMWKITPKEISDAVFDTLAKVKKKAPMTVENKASSPVTKVSADIDSAINRLGLPKKEWKALFPVSSIESNHYAGGPVHIWTVIHALLHNNINVVVVTPNEFLFDRDFRDFPNRDKLHIIVDKDAGNGITDKSFCFDFVVGMQPCGGTAVALGKEFDVPSYLWLFDPTNYVDRYKNIKPGIKQKWEDYKGALRQADYIVVLTDAVKEWVEKWLGQNGKKIIRLYPCVNSIEADRVKSEGGHNEVIFIGRVTPDKHPEELFLSLKKIKNPPLIHFVGPVDQESSILNDLQALSKQTKIDFKIHERITDYEKFNLLSRSKALIYPSHYEGFGLPPLEANYMRTPSVVYDLPSYQEWSKKVLKIVPFGDKEAFRKQVFNVLTKSRKTPHRLNVGRFSRLCEDVARDIPPFRPSVIMTVYNEEEYIEYALRSIYSWAYEIIIVEGVVENMYKTTGSCVSTDKTSNIIETFITEWDTDKKIKYKKFYRTFRDKIELQNEALKEITGNIIFKLDGDEVYKEEHLDLLRDAYLADPNLDLIYFTTLTFWTSFKLITHGPNWDVAHFKIARYKKGMRYKKGHSEMQDASGETVDWHSTKYKTIYMPEVVNYHFGWCKKLKSVVHKLNFIKNRQFDKIDAGLHDTYSEWKYGNWSDPCKKEEGVVTPFLGELPTILSSHPYQGVEDVK